MSIKLDWEVESDGGWQEVGEDPAAIAARLRRTRQLRNIGLVLLLILAAAGGTAAYRLAQVNRQLKEDLEATVAAETAALRIGDRRAFLKLQADVGEWVRIQDHTFAAYGELGSRLEVTGEIVDIDLDSDKARVTVGETLDGRPYHLIWFYQHGEDGWQHIPPGAEFWGAQQSDNTANVNLSFYDEDEELAQVLKIKVNGWMETACRVTACRRQPRQIELRIEPDPLATLGWASYDDNTLIVPSPRLSRMPADGSVDPFLLDGLAGLVAEFWAAGQIEGVPQPYSEQAWLRDDLAAYLYGQFGGMGVQTTFFDALAATYGPAFVREFLEGMQSIDSAARLVAVLTGADVWEMNLYWDSYLAYRLNAEAALIADGHPVEAGILFRDPERDPGVALPDFPSEALAVPGTMEVLSTRVFGDVLWAEIRFVELKEGDGPTDPVIHSSFEPFRLVDGRWVHSYAIKEDWGEPRELVEANVTILYFALDEPGVAELMVYLRELYGQIEPDLGLDLTVPAVEVVISPPAQTGGMVVLEGPRPRAAGQDESRIIHLLISSPYATVRTVDQAIPDYLKEMAGRKLIERSVIYRLTPFPANHPFGVAFMRWAMEQREIDADSAIAAFLAEQGRSSVVWPPEDAGGSFMRFTPPYSDTDYFSAYVLVRTMTDLYGSEVVAKLLYYLPVARDVDDWLTLTAGVTFTDIQGDWQNLYLRLLSE